MKNNLILTAITLCVSAFCAQAQFLPDSVAASGTPTVLTLDDALKIALSENVSVKVADREIERSEYARRGSYSALFPQINGSGSYQRAIRKQVMYMGGGDDSGSSSSGMFDSILAPVMYYINQLYAGTGVPFVPYVPDDPGEEESSDGGIEVGRTNTFSFGLSAAMPLVNAQLWESLKLSGQQVELAVEQARESRLNTVTQVKQAFYAALLAKEAFDVYKEVYENAVVNFNRTESRYKVDKASELEYTRAKAGVAAAIPNVYNAESSVILALWQLKAVMGVDLDMDIDVAGKLEDYAETMFRDLEEGSGLGLEGNSSLKQLALQAEQLATSIRMQQYAYLPTLSLSFNYSVNAMANNFQFSQYHWTPYSFIGVSLSIPIFSGGQRYYQVRQSRVQADELELQRVNAERQLKIGIRQSLQTMETAMKSHAAAADAVATARKAYDITAKSYQVGRSTFAELNDAQLALTQTQLQASQAIYNFVVAKATLEQTLGCDFIGK